MQISTEGIVLKQRKIANNRRLVVVFTKDYGKITAGTSINERSKSKAALALRPFTYAEYNIFKGRDYYNIDGTSVLKSYYSIGEDIDRFMICSKLIDYLDGILPEGQKKPRLFELTQEFMESVVRMEGDYSTLLFAFIVKTLKLQGVMPEIKACVNCGRELDGNSGFSIEAGGMLCQECLNRVKLSGESLIYAPSFDIVNTLRYFSEKPLANFERIRLKEEVTEELRKLISRYVEYYLDVKILEGELDKWLK